MLTHVGLFGVLNIFGGALFMLFGISVILAKLGALSWGSLDALGHEMGFVQAGGLALFGLPMPFVGIGLLRRKPWARVFGMVLSVFYVVAMPIGTVFGVYGLWALFDWAPARSLAPKTSTRRPLRWPRLQAFGAYGMTFAGVTLCAFALFVLDRPRFSLAATHEVVRLVRRVVGVKPADEPGRPSHSAPKAPPHPPEPSRSTTIPSDPSPLNPPPPPKTKPSPTKKWPTPPAAQKRPYRRVGGFYQWVDEHGQTHFSNDFTKIPPKRR